MDFRELRLAQNEVIFREVNEQVRKVAADHGNDAHLYEFFCECSNADCNLKLALSVPEYEAVRAHGHWFVIAPGHVLPEIEHTVERHDGYDVVAKEADAAKFVEELDPRS